MQRRSEWMRSRDSLTRCLGLRLCALLTRGHCADGYRGLGSYGCLVLAAAAVECQSKAQQSGGTSVEKALVGGRQVVVVRDPPSAMTVEALVKVAAHLLREGGSAKGCALSSETGSYSSKACASATPVQKMAARLLQDPAEPQHLLALQNKQLKKVLAALDNAPHVRDRVPASPAKKKEKEHHLKKKQRLSSASRQQPTRQKGLVVQQSRASRWTIVAFSGVGRAAVAAALALPSAGIPAGVDAKLVSEPAFGVSWIEVQQSSQVRAPAARGPSKQAPKVTKKVMRRAMVAVVSTVARAGAADVAVCAEVHGLAYQRDRPTELTI